jgi:hypothetical protein
MATTSNGTRSVGRSTGSTHAIEMKGASWWFAPKGLELEWRFDVFRRLLSSVQDLEGDFVILDEIYDDSLADVVVRGFDGKRSCTHSRP